MRQHWTDRFGTAFPGSSLGCLIGVGTLTAALVWASPATAAVLSDWLFDPSTRQLSVTLPKGVTPRFLVFAEPTRIVLEVPDTQLSQISAQSYAGVVESIEAVQYNTNTVRIQLVLAPGTVIDRRHAELSSADVGGQTQWTLTPLIVDSNSAPVAAQPPSPASTSPSSSPAAAELPPIPATPNEGPPTVAAPPESTPPESTPPESTAPQFIQTPEGELSISASNLTLPPASDRQLPNTLPVDPFGTSFSPNTQVSVPSLDETFTGVTNPSLVSVPGPEAMPSNPVSGSGAIAPPPVATASTTSSPQANSVEPITNEPAVAIAVDPPTPLGSSTPNTPTSTDPVAPPFLDVTSGLPPTTETETAAVRATVDPSPQPNPSATATTEPIAPPFLEAPPSSPTPTSEGVNASTPMLPVPMAPVAAEPLPTPQPPFIENTPAPVTPPLVASTPSAQTATSALPPAAIPTPKSAVAEPVPFLTAEPPAHSSARSSSGGPVAFGEPLPNAAVKESTTPSFPYLTPPSTSEQSPRNPEVLIPKGTLLKVRYPGTQSLQLNQTSTVDVGLVLETDLKDAYTGSVIAPAGSQIRGQFKPDEMGQRWVGQTLLLPGRQVDLSSASGYFVGPAQVSGQRLAVNSGIGALALTVLTGFTGVGLLGGAFLGATTAVGTAPQVIVVEPNQVIEVQILEDIPRSALHL